ncbi:hypothetical protein CR513_36822, partial [Mucuna pruriens]
MNAFSTRHALIAILETKTLVLVSLLPYIMAFYLKEKGYVCQGAPFSYCLQGRHMKEALSVTLENLRRCLTCKLTKSRDFAQDIEKWPISFHVIRVMMLHMWPIFSLEMW